MSVEYKDWYPKVTSACFNLTDSCNLKCRYCFVEQQPHFMTLQTAKDAVNFLIENQKWKKEHSEVTNDIIHITYFGGEPMLLYEEIIKPLTLWCEETFPNQIAFGITTNGTLLNKERIDFLKEHNIYPLLSIDGAPTTQNHNRPCRDETKSSFDLVFKNIPYLLEQFPGVTFRATIDQNTVQHTFENYLFATAMGFKNIFMIPNSHTEWTQDQLNMLDEQFGKIYNYILDVFRAGRRPIFSSPINESFKRVLEHDLDIVKNRQNFYKGFKRPVKRCGLGTLGCSIAYDGTIYGCQEQDSQSEADLFRIGNIYTGIDKEKHLALLEAYDNSDIIQCADPSICDQCQLRTMCKTYICPSSSWSVFKNLTTNGVSYCRWLQIMFHYAVQVMKILTEENNENFHDYLAHNCGFNTLFKGGY